MATLTPGEIAHRDQVLASLNVNLDTLVDTARDGLAQGHDPARVLEAMFVGHATACQTYGVEHSYRMLAVAIVRLAQQSTRDGAR